MTNLLVLNLSDNELSGEIPAELGELTSLQRLYLNSNMLSGEIPTELGDLTSLQELGLWDNELTGEIPTELGKMVDRAVLRTLYSNNGGSDWTNQDKWFPSNEDPTEIFLFSGWYGVEPEDDGRFSGLDLSDNGLSGELTNALEALDDLETLDLSGNPELRGNKNFRWA